MFHTPLWVNPDGSFNDAVTERPIEGSIKAWFQPNPSCFVKIAVNIIQQKNAK